jgi:hypothetical protein
MNGQPTGHGPGPLDGRRRLIYSVDLSGFGALEGSRQPEAQRVFDEIVRASLDQAGVRVEDTYLEGKGDAFIAILPADTVERDAVPNLVRAVRLLVAQHNRHGRYPRPLRLRLSFGQGVIEKTSPVLGVAGDAVITVVRHRDAAGTKAALADRPDAEVVVVLTEDLYRAVVVPARSELLPEDCTTLDVRERQAEPPRVCYLWLPPSSALAQNAPAPTAAAEPAAGAVGTTASPERTDGITTGGLIPPVRVDGFFPGRTLGP